MTALELGIRVAQQNNVPGHLKQAYARGFAGALEKRAMPLLYETPAAYAYTPEAVEDVWNPMLGHRVGFGGRQSLDVIDSLKPVASRTWATRQPGGGGTYRTGASNLKFVPDHWRNVSPRDKIKALRQVVLAKRDILARPAVYNTNANWRSNTVAHHAPLQVYGDRIAQILQPYAHKAQQTAQTIRGVVPKAAPAATAAFFF